MILSHAEEEYLRGKVDEWFTQSNDTAVFRLYDAGFKYPVTPPEIWKELPDEWDKLMDDGGIYKLSQSQLEEYLEKWSRLTGYADWVQGVWQDRVCTLERCKEFVKDYIYAKADGSREQKAAVAGSHPITAEVLDKLIQAERKLTSLNGLLKRWEKIEFTISRAITNRGQRSY